LASLPWRGFQPATKGVNLLQKSLTVCSWLVEDHATAAQKLEAWRLDHFELIHQARQNFIMMKEMPITIRRSIELIGIFVIGVIIYIGKIIIMPLLLAFFLSLMLMPLFRLFRGTKFPEPIAIILSILCLIIFGGLVAWLFYTQVASLINDIPPSAAVSVR